MQKLYYLFFGDEDFDPSRLQDATLSDVLPVLRRSGGEEISLFIEDDHVAGGSPIRQNDRSIRAALSFRFPPDGERSDLERALGSPFGWDSGYLVQESRPLVHDRIVGERTPGMMQLSCVCRRDDISQQEFRRIWHDDHAEVAISTQSTFGYVRNEIIRSLSPSEPAPWSAMVEEFFPIEALDDPMVFFDAKTKAELDANRMRMIESCNRFLDLTRIEVVFMSEYFFG